MLCKMFNSGSTCTIIHSLHHAIRHRMIPIASRKSTAVPEPNPIKMIQAMPSSPESIVVNGVTSSFVVALAIIVVVVSLTVLGSSFFYSSSARGSAGSHLLVCSSVCGNRSSCQGISSAWGHA